MRRVNQIDSLNVVLPCSLHASDPGSTAKNPQSDSYIASEEFAPNDPSRDFACIGMMRRNPKRCLARVPVIIFLNGILVMVKT